MRVDYKVIKIPNNDCKCYNNTYKFNYVNRYCFKKIFHCITSKYCKSSITIQNPNIIKDIIRNKMNIISAVIALDVFFTEFSNCSSSKY